MSISKMKVRAERGGGMKVEGSGTFSGRGGWEFGGGKKPQGIKRTHSLYLKQLEKNGSSKSGKKQGGTWKGTRTKPR